MGVEMGFGKFGFGKMSNLFSSGANNCAPQTGGHHGPFDLGQLGHHLGGGFGHGSGSHGPTGSHAGGHSGQHHDGHHGGHHGGLPGGDDCADDEDSDAGSHGGGSGGGTTGGTGFPDIPADTSGITFHVDYDGDGTMDNYYPVGRASDTKTFEDYYGKAKEQILADHPDVKPSDVVIKATITSRSGGETYYHFTGLEEGDETDCGKDKDDDDDACDDDRDHDGHGGGSHGGGHGHGKGRGHRDDRDEDDSDNDDDDDSHGGGKHAKFFKALMGHGGKSFDCNSNDDDDDHAEDDDDSDDDHGFGFC